MKKLFVLAIILVCVIALTSMSYAENSERIEELKKVIQQSQNNIQRYQNAMQEARDVIIAANAVVGELQKQDEAAVEAAKIMIDQLNVMGESATERIE